MDNNEDNVSFLNLISSIMPTGVASTAISDTGSQSSEGEAKPWTNDNNNDDQSRKRQRIDRHEEARRIKREARAAIKARYLDDQAIYDVLTENKKALSEAVWLADKAVAQMVHIKGNFWKTHGYHSPDGSDYLNAEEALLLCEKGLLNVLGVDKQRLCLKELYEAVVESISFPCYHVYTKLKGLDYIALRHSNDQRPRTIESIEQMYDISRRLSPSDLLLDAVAAYDVFQRTKSFSKRSLSSARALSYVVVTTCKTTFPADIMLRLIDESAGVPIIFAVMSLSTLHVMLEEFCDANIAFDWNNEVAVQNSLSFDIPSTVNEQLTAYNDKKHPKYGFRCGSKAYEISGSGEVNTGEEAQEADAKSEAADPDVKDDECAANVLEIDFTATEILASIGEGRYPVFDLQ